MHNLKSILERNIDIERQRLYKEKEYSSHRDYEAYEIFQHEVACIQKLFDDQNPLYSSFYLAVEFLEGQSFEVKLCTLRESLPAESVTTTEYFYRGHVVKKDTQQEPEVECVSEVNALWLKDKNKWAILQPSISRSAEPAITEIGNRSDLIKIFLNLTVKEIAQHLEREANET